MSKRKIKLFKINFFLPKRQKFILVTLLLTLGLVTTQTLESNLRFLIVGILGLSAFFLSAWALAEDLGRIKWFTLLILPAIYTAAVGFSYFLLPVRWITRLPVATLYAIGMYALLLTENIYNVAAIRTIQLLRAAHAVGFLITLVTAFLLFEILFSFHLPFYLIFLGVFILTFPLIIQFLWAANLEEGISLPVWRYSLLTSLVLAELSLIFSFWPLNLSLYALFLTTVAYAFLGISQQKLLGRLFPRTVGEFLLVPFLVFFLLLFNTHWG